MTRVSDRTLGIAMRVLVVACVVVAAFIGYLMWSNTQSRATTSNANRAVENLRAAVVGSPGDPSLRVQLANALLYTGDESGAIEQYNAALEIDPEITQALSGLATIAMARGDHRKAESYWKKVISILGRSELASKDLRLDQAYYGLGVTYIELKRYEEAVVNLKEALRIKDTASDTHYMLSVAYARLGYTDKQRDELILTLAFEPTNAQANYDIGMLALQAGETATAAEAFRISADRAPDSIDLPREELRKIEKEADAGTRLTKAIRLKETDSATALTEARIAFALDPTSVEAVRLISELWEQKGENELALKAYKALAELEPDDALAAEAIKRLSADVQQ